MIEKGIGPFTNVFKRANVEIASRGAAGAAEEAASGVTLSEDERQIYALVDGKKPIQEIVERSILGEFETCRLLFELMGRQLVETMKAAGQKVAAPAEIVPVVARRVPPILLGLGYLAMILLGGGVLLYRARPLVK